MCSPEIQTITVKGANAAGKYQLKMNGVKTDNIDISESETPFEAKLKAAEETHKNNLKAAEESYNNLKAETAGLREK